MTSQPYMSPDAAQAIMWVERLDHKLRDRQPRIREWDRAYAGVHRLEFVSEDFAKHIKGRYEGFSDNWCAVVADAPAERIDVTGIRLAGDAMPPAPAGPSPDVEPGPGTDLGLDPAENESALSSSQPTPEERWLWTMWQRNALPEQSNLGWLETMIAGRTNVLVWADESGDPMVSWEHPLQTIVAHDPEFRMRRTAALKRWVDDDMVEHATLYLPDRVWKFTRGSLGWGPRPDTEMSIPNPMGIVPMVEMCNRPRLAREPVSEVAGALAIQKAINLLWFHLLNASDFASLPQRVIMGVEPPTVPILDDDGRVIGQQPASVEDLERIKRDRIMWLRGQNPQIGSWPVADLKAYTEVIELLVGHLAAQTRTPQNYLIGKLSNVSPETVLGMEAGLVQKVRQAEQYLNQPVREVFALMATVVGNAGLADAARLGEVVWRNPEIRSDAQRVDAALKMASIPDFPKPAIARHLELNPSDTDLYLGVAPEVQPYVPPN